MKNKEKPLLKSYETLKQKCGKALKREKHGHIWNNIENTMKNKEKHGKARQNK